MFLFVIHNVYSLSIAHKLRPLDFAIIKQKLDRNDNCVIMIDNHQGQMYNTEHVQEDQKVISVTPALPELPPTHSFTRLHLVKGNFRKIKTNNQQSVLVSSQICMHIKYKCEQKYSTTKLNLNREAKRNITKIQARSKDSYVVSFSGCLCLILWPTFYTQYQYNGTTASIQPIKTIIDNFQCCVQVVCPTERGENPQ